MTTLASRVNYLRAAVFHLRAQVEAGVDTTRATIEDAEAALENAERQLAAAESEARQDPGCAHLFRRSPKRTGRTRVLSPQSTKAPTSKEDNMARQSKAAQLEETVVALRKAEKSAGSTKWALSGKGAEKNPPDAKRKKHLKEKLGREQALVAELRAKRDELKA